MMPTSRFSSNAVLLVCAAASVGAFAVGGCSPEAKTADAPPASVAPPSNGAVAPPKPLPGMPPPKPGQTYIPGSTLGADGLPPGAATQPTK